MRDEKCNLHYHRGFHILNIFAFSLLVGPIVVFWALDKFVAFNLVIDGDDSVA